MTDYYIPWDFIERPAHVYGNSQHVSPRQVLRIYSPHQKIFSEINEEVKNNLSPYFGYEIVDFTINVG